MRAGYLVTRVVLVWLLTAVNGTLWEDLDEVAAFEELVGSHGGMGGEQSFPFLLFSHGWEPPDEDVIGAEAVHRHFRRWLAALGHHAYR